jgi:hypothetical protein
VNREIESDRPSMGARAGSLIARLLLATAATAFAGAVINFFYELVFRPNPYAAGPPIARGAFLIVWTSPFILVGLIVLGLPTSYLLKRFKVEHSVSYALTGAIAGIAYGVPVDHHAAWLALVALFGAGSALFWWWFRPRG